MSTSVSKIRKVISAAGGLKKFPSRIRHNKPTGCPSRNNLRKDLQSLSNEERNVAFEMGLIGNNNKKGTIVPNATSTMLPKRRKVRKQRGRPKKRK